MTTFPATSAFESGAFRCRHISRPSAVRTPCGRLSLHWKDRVLDHRRAGRSEHRGDDPTHQIDTADDVVLGIGSRAVDRANRRAPSVLQAAANAGRRLPSTLGHRSRQRDATSRFGRKSGRSRSSRRARNRSPSAPSPSSADRSALRLAGALPQAGGAFGSLMPAYVSMMPVSSRSRRSAGFDIADQE